MIDDETPVKARGCAAITSFNDYISINYIFFLVSRQKDCFLSSNNNFYAGLYTIWMYTLISLLDAPVEKGIILNVPTSRLNIS